MSAKKNPLAPTYKVTIVLKPPQLLNVFSGSHMTQSSICTALVLIQSSDTSAIPVDLSNEICWSYFEDEVYKKKKIKLDQIQLVTRGHFLKFRERDRDKETERLRQKQRQTGQREREKK